MFVESINKGKYTINVGDKLVLDGQKGVRKISIGRYEVTRAVLTRLQKGFNIYSQSEWIAINNR